MKGVFTAGFSSFFVVRLQHGTEEVTSEEEEEEEMGEVIYLFSSHLTHCSK